MKQLPHHPVNWSKQNLLPSLPLLVHVILSEGPAGPGLVSLCWQMNKESRRFTCTVHSDWLCQLARLVIITVALLYVRSMSMPLEHSESQGTTLGSTSEVTEFSDLILARRMVANYRNQL